MMVGKKCVSAKEKHIEKAEEGTYILNVKKIKQVNLDAPLENTMID
jgi:hypothetical protein